MKERKDQLQARVAAMRDGSSLERQGTTNITRTLAVRTQWRPWIAPESRNLHTVDNEEHDETVAGSGRHLPGEKAAWVW